MDQTAFSKLISGQIPSCSSLLRIMLSRMNFRPSRMVGKVATSPKSVSMILISDGDRERSRGLKVAIDAGPTPSAGLSIFSP